MESSSSKTLTFHDILFSIPLTVYIFWLLSFPMEGFLLPKDNNFLFFLLSNSIGFFSIAIINKTTRETLENYLEGISPIVIFVLMITFAFHLHTSNALLALIGFFSSFYFIRCIKILQLSQNAIPLSAASLIFSNILLIIFMFTKPNYLYAMIFLSILILTPLLYKPAKKTEYSEKSGISIKPYYGLIAAFYIFSGWFYSVDIPAYSASSIMYGLENLFYLAGLGLSIFLYSKLKDITLIFGSICIFIAMALFDLSNILLIHLSTFSIQLGYGFIDAFFIMLFVSSEETEFSVGTGMGVMTFSIFIGSVLFLKTSHVISPIQTGNMLLTFILAATLIVFIRKKEKNKISLIINKEEKENREIGLSNREEDVLRYLIEGKKMKEIANMLGISESSVKTYTLRIYKKMGVKNRKELQNTVNKNSNNLQK